jgi:hypothetical protein
VSGPSVLANMKAVLTVALPAEISWAAKPEPMRQNSENELTWQQTTQPDPPLSANQPDPMSKVILHLNCLWLFALPVFLAGCTTGPMYVGEVHYYKVASATNANYFRLTVNAETHLGVAKYRSGFFPARSVDSLYGEVSSTAGVDALRTRDEIEKLINTNVFLVTSNWLQAARDPDTPTNRLAKIGATRSRLLTYPLPQLAPGTALMDYDPIRGVVERHGDEKMVFFLASNPDDVINKIANFTETDATVLTINRLSTAAADQRRGAVEARGAALQVNQKYDALAYRALLDALRVATNSASTTPDALKEINSLIELLDAQP